MKTYINKSRSVGIIFTKRWENFECKMLPLCENVLSFHAEVANSQTIAVFAESVLQFTIFSRS